MIKYTKLYRRFCSNQLGGQIMNVLTKTICVIDSCDDYKQLRMAEKFYMLASKNMSYNDMSLIDDFLFEKQLKLVGFKDENNHSRW
jgi:hypothetical protein